MKTKKSPIKSIKQFEAGSLYVFRNKYTDFGNFYSDSIGEFISIKNDSILLFLNFEPNVFETSYLNCNFLFEDKIIYPPNLFEGLKKYQDPHFQFYKIID